MAYNGWSNYETWNVKLWMDNDEGSYRFWNERTLEIWEEEGHSLQNATTRLSDELKDFHQENMPEVQGTYADLLGAALSEVDWYEIAESLVGDAELTEEEAS